MTPRWLTVPAARSSKFSVVAEIFNLTNSLSDLNIIVRGGDHSDYSLVALLVHLDQIPVADVKLITEDAQMLVRFFAKVLGGREVDIAFFECLCDLLETLDPLVDIGR